MAVLTSQLKPTAMTVALFNPDLMGSAAIAAAVSAPSKHSEGWR